MIVVGILNRTRDYFFGDVRGAVARTSVAARQLRRNASKSAS
jgi:hypothetical protein